MISFHTTPRKTMIRDTICGSSRKRRWEPDEREEEEEGRSKAREFLKMERSGSGEPGSSGIDVELHLKTPLPVEWERCLDIQSGEVHFYNTRMNKRTCKDPGEGDQTTSDLPTTTSAAGGSISLNLELNLPPYDDQRSHPEAEAPYSSIGFLVEEDRRGPLPEKKAGKGVGEEEEEEEMVATVCERCNMLVMLCVSRPACPNCKFLRPKPDHTPFTLLL